MFLRSHLYYFRPVILISHIYWISKYYHNMWAEKIVSVKSAKPDRRPGPTREHTSGAWEWRGQPSIWFESRPSWIPFKPVSSLVAGEPLTARRTAYAGDCIGFCSKVHCSSRGRWVSRNGVWRRSRWILVRVGSRMLEPAMVGECFRTQVSGFL